MALRHVPDMDFLIRHDVTGQEEVKVKQVPASEVPPPRTTEREKTEVKPRKGSSAGMNYNPGGPPPGAEVD